MLTLVITPQLVRSEAETEAMRGTFANRADYEYLIDEDALIIGPDGIVARLVTGCLNRTLVRETALHFYTVRGDLSARPAAVGKGAMMYRLRETDGTMGHTKEVPFSVRQQLRRQNTYSDFLGWMDASNRGDRFPDCRQTAWSRNNPEVHGAAVPFMEAVDRVYREELPEHYARQKEFIDGVLAEWKFDGTGFSTCTVNRNLRTPYHTDPGDFAGGMGNLIVLDSDGSGPLVMPQYRLALLPRPTDVLLMNVHSMHGNGIFTGERLTAVLYARKHIDKCGREY
jgi:hypothetical protein